MCYYHAQLFLDDPATQPSLQLAKSWHRATKCWLAPSLIRSQLYTPMVTVHMHFESFLCGSRAATFSALKHSIWSGEVGVALMHLNRVPACKLLSTQLTHKLRSMWLGPTGGCCCYPWLPQPYTVKVAVVTTAIPATIMDEGGQGDCAAHGACNETPQGLLLHGQACRRGSSSACAVVAEVEGFVLLAGLRW